MAFFNSLWNIKKWFTDKVEFFSLVGSTKRKHEECEIINNKRVHTDDSLVEIVKIRDELPSETDGVEITKPGSFIVPTRASPLVLIEGSQHATSTMSPVKTIYLNESNDNDVSIKINRINSLSNPQLRSNRNASTKAIREEISLNRGTKQLSLSMENGFSALKNNDTSKNTNKNKSFAMALKYDVASKPETKLSSVKYKMETQKKNEIFPDYSKEIAESIAFKMSGSLNELIVQGKNIRLKDLKTIYISTVFVNDEVINHYLDMIADRNPTNIHTFSTFFYTKLSLQGYQSVRRWSRNKDIFEYKKIFIPILLEHHWCLICVNFIEKTVKYYDSLGRKIIECLNKIFIYLKQEYENKKNEEFDCNGWQVKYAEDCPQQQSLFDCGVFTCANAEYLSRDAKLDFVQDDMPKLRNKICYEILNNRLCN